MLSYYPVKADERVDAKISQGFEFYDGRDGDEIRAIMLNYIWSPIIWHNGERKKENFFLSHYLSLDFESPHISLKRIQAFCEKNFYWYIIGTTRNHQKVKGDIPAMDRFRLLLMFNRPITNLTEYEYNLRVITKRFGADTACVDGARLFFPCIKIIAYDCCDDSMQYPVCALPKKVASTDDLKKQWEARAVAMQASGIMPWFVKQWMHNEIPLHQRNNTCFRLGCEFYRMGILFEDAVERILASPTYANKELPANLVQEIQRTVRSGFKSAAAEKMLIPSG